MAQIKLKNINKIYPNGVHAVIDFNLEVEDKDFIVLVGPSGCGKSTTLRMIAGLEEISNGEAYIDDKLINELDPKDRDISMVFQSYALYPHMTVFENMSYGLRIKKAPIKEIEHKVVKAAMALDILDLLDRIPAELSGGQRQRVALGRAMVKEAKVFLMDEPLSNLDAKLRVQTRTELIELHRLLGNTTVYVTHDQIEAMTMATKIVVMSEGVIEQVGSPEVIYNYPNNVFVGGFIGTPPMNFIKTKVTKDGYVILCKNKVKLSEEKLTIIEENDLYEQEIVFGIRPEDIHIVESISDEMKDLCLNTKVTFSEILGSDTNVYFELANTEFILKVDKTVYYAIGDDVNLHFDTKRVHFFNVNTGKRYTSKEEDQALEELIKIGRK
ncbi:MAG TPA: sn-glycerol-3-phosphate ABC transporter ATP-binding protein UgpC [Acholeplasmataceae bacterium]|nr:sn-glycerol-3-phosphate ABC transporter ATP-binding protein UgpC [Acholeplasmataceae bacterium]